MSVLDKIYKMEFEYFQFLWAFCNVYKSSLQRSGDTIGGV